MTTAPVRGLWQKRTGAGLAIAGLILTLGYAAQVQADKKLEPGQQPPKKKKQPKLPSPKKPAPKKKIVDVLVKGESAAQVAYINEEIRKKWKETKITPSDRCTDYEVIRRASLDIIGRIAKPAEVKRFLSDPPERRRSLLIERLLASDEYATNWANIWTVWLMTRSGALNPGMSIYHEQMKVWLEEKFAGKDMQYDQMVTDLLTATGKTNENQAVNYILAHLGEPIRNNRNAGKFEMVPVTSRTTRLFLGVRTQCTQCHDHPFNDDAKQKQFWGINAFFRQVDAPLGRPMRTRQRNAVGRVLELVDNEDLNDRGRVSYERRNGLVLLTKPAFLDGTEMPELKKGDTRRKELAKFIIKSPFFAKAYVNRMWAHFLGRGFTKVVDDFGSEQNEVSHPELLEKLGKDFVRYNHRPRDLIRWICNSEAYGLSSKTNKTNDKEDAEPYFSRMLLKAMSPEQLFESLMLATGAAAAENKEDKKKLRQSWMQKLVVNFGDDEGNEATFNGTVVQALLLMNGDDINKAIVDTKTGTVARVINAAHSHRQAIAALFMAALNRPPTPAEYSRYTRREMIILPRVRKRVDKNFWNAYYQDLFWALVNSNEFILNH